MASRDLIGDRGQLAFALRISETDEEGVSRFRPAFLGDKWPHVDFIVELSGAGDGFVPFFFVQVRTTRAGYTRNGRLKVGVKDKDIIGLVAHPAPTYVVGVDEITEACYIVCANGKLESLSSLSTEYPINAVTRRVLWAEVLSSWKATTLPKIATSFDDPEWS